MPLAKRPAPESSPTVDIRSVKDLFESSAEPLSWIIKDLIREGDQVILAGPPKSGKSFLAFQLAMAVATGCNHRGQNTFLSSRFEITKADNPRNVLYFSLEMGPGVMKARLTPWGTLGGGTPPSKIDNLKYVFGINGRSTLQLDDRGSEAYRSLGTLIAKESPVLIIFDTFVRIHSLDENDNVRMAALMENLLNLCEVDDNNTRGGKRRIAHVIVHHLRKLGPDWRANRSIIEAVRGAGSIIGAADLILGMNTADRTKELRKLEFCCRHLSTIDDLTLEPAGERTGPVVFQAIETPPDTPPPPRAPGKQEARRLRLYEAIRKALTEEKVAESVPLQFLLDKVAPHLDKSDKVPGAAMFVTACRDVKVEGWILKASSQKGLRDNLWERDSPKP